MKISFELEPGDIQRFHEALERAEQRVACAEECDIVAAARHSLQTLPIETAPGYVRQRLLQVVELVEMLEDEAWALPQVERAEVLKLLAYFSDPEDLIPDDVAVIGLLDDAIMLELLLREIRHVVAAYDDFRRAREDLGAASDEAGRISRARDLARRREQLQARMRRRRVREEVTRAGNAGMHA
ncbi:MAG TPA: YkvA family protein [Arenimonas sp.]